MLKLNRETGLTILVLGVTQIIGWGTTYDLPAVFVRQISADIGISASMVMAGVTIMLGLSALISPRMGSHLARYGARRIMMIGSFMMAVGLATIAVSKGPWSYATGWLIAGLAAPMALSLASLSALTQIAGENARRALTTLLLLTGLSASIFWPLSVWLEGVLGWRKTVFVFALLHLLVCLPLHATLKTWAKDADRDVASASGRPERPLFAGAGWREIAFAGLSFSVSSFVSWGLPLQLIETLNSLDYTPKIALWAMSFLGVVQISARGIQMLIGERFALLKIASGALALMIVSLAFLVLATPHASSAVIFVVVYGLGSGMMTVVRSVGPLELFGREAYARTMGWLVLPQNLAYAAAPWVFSAVSAHQGAKAVLLTAIGVLMISSGGIVVLSRMATRTRADVLVVE